MSGLSRMSRRAGHAMTPAAEFDSIRYRQNKKTDEAAPRFLGEARMAITDQGDNTGNVFIDALAAYSFLDIGGDRNITYTFATGGNISGHPWASLTEKVQWQNALQQWVNVANITTQEVFPSDADLREAWVDTGQMTVAHGLGPDGLPYPSYHDLPQSGVGGPNGMYNRGYNTRSFRQPE